VQVYAPKSTGLPFDKLRTTLNHRLKREIFMAWMYILECSDNSYYVGSTKDLERRLSQHQEGTGSRYTSGRLPVQLVYCEEYDRVSDAFYREKQVQGWTPRKREALITGIQNCCLRLQRRFLIKAKLKTIRWLSRASGFLARIETTNKQNTLVTCWFRHLHLRAGASVRLRLAPQATQPTVLK